MKNELQALSFSVIVDAVPEAAYFAFTNPGGFRGWLCDQSQVDPKAGGRLYLWWRSGYFVSGIFNSLDPNSAVAFTWYGREEPWETQVQVIFSQADGGTQIDLKHFGIGTGEEWGGVVTEYKKGWEKGLENLQSVLESGQDLRIVRRPILGVQIGGILTPAEAGALNVPRPGAIRVEAVVPDTGAAVAGVQGGDLLVSLGDLPVSTIADLSHALDRYYAGDRVELGLIRGGAELVIEMELSARRLPSVPGTPGAFADAVQKANQASFQEVCNLLEGVKETEAEYRLKVGEWHIKHNLAHLIVVERDTQSWIAAACSDAEAEFNTNELTRLDALLQVYSTVPDLLSEFERSQTETVAMIRALPATFVRHRKGRYVELGYGLLNATFHTEQHREQMTGLIGAARMGSRQ
jgi:uncharacterized protein YndB with AHSA1/START domain